MPQLPDVVKFGSIFGYMVGLSALGGIVGPLFAGWVFDTWGSYQFAWLVLAALVFLAVMVIATTPPVTAGAQYAGKQ